MPDANVTFNARPPARLHPLALRIMHWINAVAMLVLILSGWAIYNDEVIFGRLHFPHWMTLGDGPEGALQWHFLAMWILGANGIAYLAYGLATRRFRRMLLPIRPMEVLAEIRAALALKLSHDDLTRYNAVQRTLYVGIILVGIVQVLSGLAIWKPVQLSELAILFYDFQTARLVHFLGMAAIVGFLLVHVAPDTEPRQARPEDPLPPEQAHPEEPKQAQLAEPIPPEQGQPAEPMSPGQGQPEEPKPQQAQAERVAS
jgi:thiosulfate reductase cytochrome b subunit